MKTNSVDTHVYYTFQKKNDLLRPFELLIKVKAKGNPFVISNNVLSAVLPIKLEYRHFVLRPFYKTRNRAYCNNLKR